MTASIALGMCFGDEGKGIFTDYLCLQHSNSIVIRFSGGPQSTHTVVTDENSHVFTNFGSGTLRGIPTYWSKFCPIEPRGILNELFVLLKKGIKPTLYIDENCPVVTPFDMKHNQESEKKNGHGSCGVGFGATINREEKHYSLTFMDLFYPDILQERLRLIENFYNFSITHQEVLDFIHYCKMLVNHEVINKIGSPTVLNKDHFIFEGSQGLLLDQNFGFFPNVTRSNTGCENAIDLLKSWNIRDRLEIFLITRAYQTRHGPGFMTNENIPHNIKENPEETNVENEWQGKFRKSILDLSLLEYAINRDPWVRKADKNLVITCLDHVQNEHRLTYKGKIIGYTSEQEFIEKIAKTLKIRNVYISRTNNSKNINLMLS